MRVFFSDGVYSDFALIYWRMAKLLVHWKAENLHAASWKILQVQWSCRSGCGRTKYCSSCDASHWAVRCTNVDKVICCTESAELGRHWRRECKKWTENGTVFLECWYNCSYCMFYGMWSVSYDCVHDLCVNICTAKSIASKPFSFRNPVWGKQTCSVKLQIVHNYCKEIVGLTCVLRTLEHLILTLEQDFLPFWGIVCAWLDCLHVLVFVL